ncbi:MAG: radical SAM protein [Chitinivibrionales bacterium]|nr:radical SAM protein [Chitinivibrionales bacterium]
MNGNEVQAQYDDWREWYERNYPSVSGQGLWLTGGALNTLAPSCFSQRPYKLLISRLSTYRDTAASFSHQVLYQIATEVETIFADISFLPPAADCTLFEADSVPWLLGIETKKGPHHFDCIALSNATILELINLPTVLSKSGIPLSKKERLRSVATPLILLGGSNSAATRSLCNSDPAIDGIFIGNDRNLIKKVFSIIAESKQNQVPKNEVLAHLESVPGFFQPEKEAPQLRSGRNSGVPISSDTFFYTGPVSSLSDHCATGHVVISNGCPFHCNFCFESWVNKPYQEFSFNAIVETCLRLKAASGCETLEISSFNFNVHSQILEILEALIEYFPSIGLKSQRFDQIATYPQLMEYLLAIGKRSISCALEGISEHIRQYLNKRLSEESLFQALKHIVQYPLRELKIFCIATGFEKERDFSEFDALLDYLASLLQYKPSKPRIIFSVTPLVRFPHTPLYHDDAVLPQELQPILHRMEQKVRFHHFEFRTAYSLNEYFMAQTLVRPLDHRIFESLCAIVQKTGFVYYSEISDDFISEFLNHLKDKFGVTEYSDIWHSIALQAVNGHKQWHAPPRHIQGFGNPITDSESDQSSPVTQSSIGPSVKAKKPNVTQPIEEQGPIFSQSKGHANGRIFLKRIQLLRKQQRHYLFSIKIIEKARSVLRKTIALALARSIMTVLPQSVTLYRGYGNSFMMADPNMVPWLYGDELLTLVWDERAKPLLEHCMVEVPLLEKINQEFKPWGTLVALDTTGRPDTMVMVPDLHLFFQSPFPFFDDGYLKKHHLRHVRKKEGENLYHYCFIDETIKKKKFVSDIHLERHAESWSVSVKPGVKFDYREFAQQAFLLPQPHDWVRIRMQVVFDQSV